MLHLLRLKDTFLHLLPRFLHDHNYHTLNPNGRELPEEILLLIVQRYVECILSEVKTIRQLRKGRKEYWGNIAPLAKSSKRFWKIAIEVWRTVWAICCSTACSSHAQCNGGRLLPGIRILTLGDDWKPESLNLIALKRLENLSIDYHKRLEYDPSSRQFRVLPGVKSFPSSLRRIEILRFHRPIEDVLSLIKASCPGLAELRLVLCTMFNNPNCVWWRVNDHRHYLVGYRRDDVVNYAATLANHIEGLPHLEYFHINHYLTNLDSVYRHRVDHKRHHPPGHRDTMNPIDGITTYNSLHLAALAPQDAPPINPTIPRLADKKLWKDVCSQCNNELKGFIEPAERLAASLLSARHKSLKAVSFASFLSPERTAPSEWMVEHQYVHDRLVVSTQRPASYQQPRRYRCEFERQATHWILLE